MLISESFGYDHIFYNRKDFSFKGSIVVPYDLKHSYYSSHTENNNMFFSVSFFYYNHLKHREDLEIHNFIKSKQKKLNSNLINNNFCSIEEIQELFIPDIKDFSKIAEDFPFVMFFHGFDDGHYFFRFKSEQERLDVFNIISNLDTADEIFYYEKENLVLFTDN